MQPPGGPAVHELEPVDSSRERTDKFGRGRLLLTLDALLATRSVTAAAKQLGLQPSGVSRILGELRLVFDDTLLIRSGRGLVPTPKAESLRPRIHAIIEEMNAVFDGSDAASDPAPPFDQRWNVPYRTALPPLASDTAPLPTDDEAAAGPREPGTPPRSALPRDRLAAVIGTIAGRRKQQGHCLDVDQADEAMSIILDGAADPVQIGAFLGLVHLQGTTAIELAGFVRAARRHVAQHFPLALAVRADLDWPCYISPKDQRPPWFFQAARLVAGAGYRVVLHGSSGSGQTAGRHSVVADLLGIPTCRSGPEATQALERGGIAYVPLPELSPQICRLLGLHALTEARSPVHELVHLLQPVPSHASLLGVGKPSYKEIHRDAAMILGERQLAIVGSSRDVAQINPFRSTTIHQLVDGLARDEFVPSLAAPTTRERSPFTSMEHWCAVWTGTARDPRAESVVIATAAAALLCLAHESASSFSDAREQATALWHNRHNG